MPSVRELIVHCAQTPEVEAYEEKEGGRCNYETSGEEAKMF